MAVTSLDDTVGGSIAAVGATSAPTAAPTGSTDGFATQRYPRVRTLLLYAGTVSSCTVTLWVRDRATGVWYRGLSTDQVEPLAPGGASAVNEAREWDVGRKQEVYFQVAAIAGGGTVAIKVQPVETGGY